MCKFSTSCNPVFNFHSTVFFTLGFKKLFPPPPPHFFPQIIDHPFQYQASLMHRSILILNCEYKRLRVRSPGFSSTHPSLPQINMLSLSLELNLQYPAISSLYHQLKTAEIPITKRSKGGLCW